MGDNNITHKVYTKTTKKINTHRIFVGGFKETPEHIEMFNALLDAGDEDTLEFRISSPGGLVTECQKFVNLTTTKFKDRNTAYIDSHASSAGAFLFCACDKRVIYENSRLMLHNYSGGYSGEYHKMKTRFEFDSEHILGFLKSTLKIGKKGFLTKDEYKRMIEGHEYWFNAKEMCTRGIATHIIVGSKELTAQEYLEGK